MTFAMRYGFVLFVVVVAVLATNSVVASNSRPPRNNDVNNLDNALNYLEDLDTYLAERPVGRYGKRNLLTQLYRSRPADNADMEGSRDVGGWNRIRLLPMPLKQRLMPFYRLNKSRVGELSTANEPF